MLLLFNLNDKNGRILLSSLTLALSHQATAEDESGQIEKVAPLFLLLLCGVNKALKNLLLLLTVSRKEETLCRGFALAPPKGGALEGGGARSFVIARSHAFLNFFLVWGKRRGAESCILEGKWEKRGRGRTIKKSSFCCVCQKPSSSSSFHAAVERGREL